MPLCFTCCVQVKTKGVRKITFEQFLNALAKLAERKVRDVATEQKGFAGAS